MMDRQRFHHAALLTGMMATFAGIGIARFAYTPMVPALVDSGWFSATAAGYLGAVNLLGYLLGALSAHYLSERFSHRAVLAFSFIGTALSFLLCCVKGDFAWFFFWRLVSGFLGAVLVVVGPSTALASIRPEQRAHTGTLMFTGIGLGILMSATVVPGLLSLGLRWTWLALGLLPLIAGWIADRACVTLTPEPHTARKPSSRAKGPVAGRFSILAVFIAYGLSGGGVVPHTVFWVDYLQRSLGLGHMAAVEWALLGAGAIAGPFASRWLASRLGWDKGLAIGLLALGLAVGLPVLHPGLVGLTISSIVVGMMIPGIVALTSGRLAELVGASGHKRAWGIATALFACFQAAGGYGLSALYGIWGRYPPLFGISAALVLTGFLLVKGTTYFNSFLTGPKNIREDRSWRHR